MLATRQKWLDFTYLLRTHAFRYGCFDKNKNHAFDKNRTHDFCTSRCAVYLLDHSGGMSVNRETVYLRDIEGVKSSWILDADPPLIIS